MSDNIRRFKYNGEDTLSLPARPEAFDTLRTWLENIAEELQLPTKTGRHLLIAADEIFTNISNYGYPAGGGSANVAVAFNMNDRVLTITFTDTGVAYNPLEAGEPDINAPLEDRQIGGLGIFMVRKLMDEVKYQRDGDRNVLILSKKLDA
ncbi:MAG: ATP-binding protein [Victivallaceae bacterium]|nr:ATP-binding protein [Victivallaceae bacterium]